MKTKFYSILILIILCCLFVNCTTTQKTDSVASTTPIYDNTDKTGLQPTTLSNQNSTLETRVLYDYIKSLSGKKILAGQQESTWMKGGAEYEMNYLFEKTGKYPAVRGLDYINNDFRGVTSRAIKWWNKGGIVTICWHWGAPPDGVGYESSKDTIDIEMALLEGTDINLGMIEKMDEVAEQLLKLQEAGVPVLWRPFHEFDGGWFWWGKGGPELFKQLWKLMYERYTYHWGLNNLIWVCGFANTMRPEWYPGDEYVDIAGSDTYDNTTHIKAQEILESFMNPDIPLALHENGRIPKPEEFINDGTKWTWFLTWHTGHITGENNPQDVSDLNNTYNSDYVITLDELPKFKE